MTTNLTADREKELLNIDYVDEVINGNNATLLDELKKFYLAKGMSEADLALTIDSTRLRKRVHAEMDDEMTRRMSVNPRPTEEELSMGAYVEHIEPQVRDAVLLLRKKGYSTACSGFSFFGWQSLIMSGPDLKDLDPSIRARLEEHGVEVKAAKMSFKAGTDMVATKALWDRIADLLPDLGRAAPARRGCNLDFARKAKKYAGHVYQEYMKYL